MSDVSFIRRNELPYCDLSIKDGDIEFGDELESALLVSILTDARCTSEELERASLVVSYAPNNVTTLRGWWGDTYSDTPLGSKIWLNARQKSTDQVLADQQSFIEESLSFLIQDGIVNTIQVNTYWTEDKKSMEAKIVVVKPDASLQEFRYQFAWEGI